LTLVGDGRCRPDLERSAAAAGVGERVRFAGQLSTPEAVRRELDAADLFVLPSFAEGLPRAMIEAMARSLPCIGSTAGGIPELLPPEHLVRPGDAAGLARAIRTVVTDPQQMTQMAARSLEQAREYRHELLRERRIAFYRHARESAEAWLKRRGRIH
jgi:glycosyltransferase involved in cell wall biosynthesis